MQHEAELKLPLTQVSVVSNGQSLFEAGVVVKVFSYHFIPPGQSGDVVHNVSIDFLGHHAEHTDLKHLKTQTFPFIFLQFYTSTLLHYNGKYCIFDLLHLFKKLFTWL